MSRWTPAPSFTRESSAYGSRRSPGRRFVFSHLQFRSRRSSALLCSLALFLEKFRGAAFQFRYLNIFDVGREEPLIAGEILHAAAAIAVELICRLHDRRRARLDRELCGYRAARWRGIMPAVTGINTQFSDHSSRRNETLFVTHDEQGRRCDGTPPFSETRLWICCRRRRACCEREGRAAAADSGGTRPRATARRSRGTRGHHARRCRSSQARRSALGPRPRASPRLAPWPPLGLAQASLGLAASPALWLAPASLGLASPPLAPPPPLLASPLLVRAPRLR